MSDATNDAALALAVRVRAAAAAFNAAVDAAYSAGISVEFTTSIWPGSPSKSLIADLFIQRMPNWDNDDPGEILRVGFPLTDQ